MNDTLKHIKERSSCRDFSDQLPTDEQMSAIAQAAIQSPSGMNRQAWQIIVVKDRGLIAEMEEEGISNLKATDDAAYQRIMSRNGTLFYRAPYMIMLAIKPSQPAGMELIDLGIAAQNAVIAATSLGLASLHCGLAGYAFAGGKAEEFKKRLAFPGGYEYGIAVLVGYAKEQGVPHEPNQAKITYIE